MRQQIQVEEALKVWGQWSRQSVGPRAATISQTGRIMQNHGVSLYPHEPQAGWRSDEVNHIAERVQDIMERLQGRYPDMENIFKLLYIKHFNQRTVARKLGKSLSGFQAIYAKRLGVFEGYWLAWDEHVA
ncbi:hypothetical protein [Magnetococcus sp. PR-3]|uniref:hypothetical protein n=1 Tax=Magnetococcus sp. PR-3 TaxID=3120355 RepID=UPI002FCE39A8